MMTEQLLFESGWEIGGLREAQSFFSALPRILPSTTYFYFEGTSIGPDVHRTLESASIPPRMRIPVGTIFPKPRMFHVLASASFLRQIVELAGKHAEPEICDHFHAYDDTRGLLQWYDAFDLPLFVSDYAPEEDLKRFCILGMPATYARQAMTWHSSRHSELRTFRP